MFTPFSFFKPLRLIYATPEEELKMLTEAESVTPTDSPEKIQQNFSKKDYAGDLDEYKGALSRIEDIAKSFLRKISKQYTQKRAVQHTLDELGNYVDTSGQESCAKIGLLGKKTAKQLGILNTRIKTADNVNTGLDKKIDSARQLSNDYRVAMNAMRKDTFWGSLRRDPKSRFERESKIYTQARSLTQEVRRDALREKIQLESSVEQEFRNFQAVDRNLRDIILKYNPNALTDMSETLSNLASGQYANFWSLIDYSLITSGEQKDIADLLKYYSSKKGQTCKIFEKTMLKDDFPATYDKTKYSNDDEKKAAVDKILQQSKKIKRGDKLEITITTSTQKFSLLETKGDYLVFREDATLTNPKIVLINKNNQSLIEKDTSATPLTSKTTPLINLDKFILSIP